MKIEFHTQNTHLIDAVKSFVEEWNEPSRCFSVKTSGSTGTPKKIEISKEYALASALTTCEYLNLSAEQHALLCLSPDTIVGKMMIVRSIAKDLILHVVEPTSSPLDLLGFSPDFIAMVPLQMQATIEKASVKLNSSQKIIIGGGPISPSLEERIKELPISAYHTFGMSETISHVALRNISAGDSYFEAVSNVSFESNHGELVINAPHLGIHQLKTNDVVELIDSKHFRWLGRTDFVINSGGVKIHPEEVEQILAPKIDVPFFIAGVKNEVLGEKVVLCVQSNDFEQDKSFFEAILSKYQIPKSIYRFESFQYTESKKINRIKTIQESSFDEKPLL